MKTWSEVASSEEFKTLPPEGKEAARQQYFRDVVAPRVPEADLSVAKAQFDKDTQKYDPSTSTARYLLSRAAGGFGGLLAANPFNPFAGNPLFTQEFMRKQAATPLGYNPSIKPPSREAEIAGGVAEFAGAGVLPSAGVVGAAAHKLPAIAAEIGSTALGGVGSEVGGLPGAIVGSVVGGYAPTAYSKLKSAVSGVVPWLRNTAESAAPRELHSAFQSHPPAAQNVVHAQEVATGLRNMGAGEFRPTLGQATGAPGLIAREEQIARSSPEDLGQYAQLGAENQAVISRARELAFPSGTPVTRVSETIKRSVTGELETRLDNINRTREAVAARLSSQPQQAVGEQLVKLRDQAQGVARDIKNKKLDEVYAAGASIREPMDDVVEVVRKIGGSDQNIFQSMPPIYGQVLRQYGKKEAELTGRSIPPDLMAVANPPAQPATFKELHSLWREANSQYATAIRAGDSQAAYLVQQVKDALKAKLDKFEQGGFGDLTAKFADFNRFYATKYAPAFKEGVGGRMGATTRYGDLLKPEDVVAKFFTPSGLDDFNLIYGADKAAQAALTDGVIGMFRQSAVKGGRIDQRAAETWVRNNQEALNKLPDVRAMLGSEVTANAALLEQAARVKANRAEFSRSAVAKIANTDNPEALVDKAIGNRQQMIQLVALAARGGQSSRNELARMIADRVPIMAERARVDPLTFVMQNRESLKPALDTLGSNHFQNLQLIMGAKTITGRTTVPSTVPAKEIADTVEQITGSTPRTIWSQSANTAAGRQSPVSAVLHLASRFGIKMRAASADQLMREAIYNPELAALWAKAATGQKLTIPESNAIKNHLFAAGARIGSAEEQQ